MHVLEYPMHKDETGEVSHRLPIRHLGRSTVIVHQLQTLRLKHIRRYTAQSWDEALEQDWPDIQWVALAHYSDDVIDKVLGRCPEMLLLEQEHAEDAIDRQIQLPRGDFSLMELCRREDVFPCS